MPAPLSNPISSGQIDDLRRNALITWHKGAEMAEQETLAVRSLFDEHAANGKYTEEHSSFSTSGFSSKSGDGEDYVLTTDTQGDTMILTQQKRTVRRIITEDMIRWNKYPQIKSLLMGGSSKLWMGYALDLAHRFTFAFDTAYTDRDGETVSTIGGDAAALCAATHTMNDGSTFDNLISARLSESSLEDAQDQGNAVVDHNGQLVMPRFDILLTGTQKSTSHMADRLTTQPWQVDSDFRNQNVYAGTLRHVELPFLDTTAAGAKYSAKSRFWFLLDTRLAKTLGHLSVSVDQFPDPEVPTYDPDNNNMTFKAKMYYDINHLDASFVQGSNAV